MSLLELWMRRGFRGSLVVIENQGRQGRRPMSEGRGLVSSRDA